MVGSGRYTVTGKSPVAEASPFNFSNKHFPEQLRRSITPRLSTSEGSNSLAPLEGSQPETTGTKALAPGDLSKAMSLFELEESSSLLLESALEAAEENGGEIPQELEQALLDYCEAFGEKVDNIARYISALRKP
jgi:hypothetical protein